MHWYKERIKSQINYCTLESVEKNAQGRFSKAGHMSSFGKLQVGVSLSGFSWFCFEWLWLLDKLNTYFQLKCRGSIENYSEMKISRIFWDLMMTRAKCMGRQTLVNDILPTIPWLPFPWHSHFIQQAFGLQYMKLFINSLLFHWSLQAFETICNLKNRSTSVHWDSMVPPNFLSQDLAAKPQVRTVEVDLLFNYSLVQQQFGYFCWNAL